MDGGRWGTACKGGPPEGVRKRPAVGGASRDSGLASVSNSGKWGQEQVRLGMLRGPQSPFAVGGPLGTMAPDAKWKSRPARQGAPGRSPSPDSCSIADGGVFHTFSELG